MNTPNSSAGGGGPVNRLLASLPAGDIETLRPDLERCTFSIRQVLYEAGGEMPYVYFVDRGVICAVTLLEDGSEVEAFTTGNEGIVGSGVALGRRVSSVQVIVQIEGSGYRIPSERFREHMAKNARLNATVFRYLDVLMTTLTQLVACNGVHAVEQRCARWMLLAHDRVEKDRFRLTQEFLAQLLAVRRSSVNRAAQMLQNDSLIRYHQGTIEILDRLGLEEAACECYGVIRTELDRYLEGTA